MTLSCVDNVNNGGLPVGGGGWGWGSPCSHLLLLALTQSHGSRKCSSSALLYCRLPPDDGFCRSNTLGIPYSSANTSHAHRKCDSLTVNTHSWLWSPWDGARARVLTLMDPCNQRRKRLDAAACVIHDLLIGKPEKGDSLWISQVL